jgi:hypothetical protein
MYRELFNRLAFLVIVAQHTVLVTLPILYLGCRKCCNCVTFADDHFSAWSKEEIITNINSAIACAVQRRNAITVLASIEQQQRLS